MSVKSFKRSATVSGLRTDDIGYIDDLHEPLEYSETIETAEIKPGLGKKASKKLGRPQHSKSRRFSEFSLVKSRRSELHKEEDGIGKGRRKKKRNMIDDDQVWKLCGRTRGPLFVGD